MSSSDFSKVKVLDDVLATTDSVKYAVVKGAQNITPSVNNAISKSNSSITFNIQTPSEATVLSRRIMLQTKICFRVSGVLTTAGRLLDIGNDSALGPFPFQSLCNTIQMTINNNTVTQNQRDVMFALMRFGDARETYRYNTSTPTAYDQYWNYSDALLASNNPNGAWNNVSNDPSYQPRGAFKLESIAGNSVGVIGDTKNVDIVVEVTEPLMLSPLIWCDPQSNNQGFYGIQVLNLVFNIGSTNRLFRSSNPNATAGLTVSLGFPAGVSNGNAFLDTRLLIQYYTRQPSDLVPARNVVPYAEYPRYITNVSGTIPASTQAPGVVAGADFALVPGAFPTIESNSISLNQIPDKILIFVRKRLASQTAEDADCFFPIKRLRVNFNNKAGLLTSATRWDLWRMSVESGSNQTWAEFSGSAVRRVANQPLSEIATCGSVLALSMGKHIELDDVFAPGSIGQFQLQFSVEIENYDSVAYADNTELVLITMNTGVFVLERGTSQTYTAILSRSDVLSASSMPGYKSSDVKRLVGGAMEDGYKSLVGLPDLGAGQSGGAMNGCGQSGGGYSGGGQSGGGQSGGGLSGGARMKKHLM
jgi:uncharacterized membrane protein YgcG